MVLVRERQQGLQGHGATLLFMDGHMDSGTIVSFAKDTTSYVRKMTAEILRVPTSTLRSLQVERPATWDGAGLGFLIGGAGTGLVFGVAAASTQPSEYPVGPVAAYGFVVGGLGGGGSWAGYWFDCHERQYICAFVGGEEIVANSITKI